METWIRQNVKFFTSSLAYFLFTLFQHCFIYHPLDSTVWDTLQRKSDLCIPFLGIAWPQSQFPHSCACERFIYSQDRFTKPHIFLRRIGRPIMGIYKSLTDAWMWKLFLFREYLFRIFGIVSLQYTVGGCWEWIQDCCGISNDSQTSPQLLGLIHSQLLKISFTLRLDLHFQLQRISFTL